MNSDRHSQGIILSSRIIVAHQIATLLERQGWQMSIEHDRERAWQLIHDQQPALLVADIDAPDMAGARMLAEFRRHHPAAQVMALCTGGNSQGMRIVRALGADGYFYMHPHGRTLDTLRGMARLCMHDHMPQRQAHACGTLFDIGSRNLHTTGMNA